MFDVMVRKNADKIRSFQTLIPYRFRHAANALDLMEMFRLLEWVEILSVFGERYRTENNRMPPDLGGEG